MELWAIIVLSYLAFVFLSVIIVWIVSKNWGDWWVIPLFTILIAIWFPFYILVAIPSVFLDNRKKFKTFTIHKLTEDNKTTLRQMGFFEADDYVSCNNFSWVGFRLNGISVCYNGRVSCRYSIWLSEEEKHLLKIIKNLPNQEPKVFEGEK